MRAEVGHGSFSFSFMPYYIDILSILPRESHTIASRLNEDVTYGLP